MTEASALALVLALLGACGERPPERAGADAGAGGDVGLASALGGEAGDDFARASGTRSFDFPADHGPHPAYRNEWWYVTGNLTSADGRRFGFQLTLFRIGLAPGRAERESAWATRQIWMGHLALTDVAGERFHDFERFARGGDLGLAGAGRDPVRVWLDGWHLERAPDGTWRLDAAAGDIALDLDLDPRQGPVLQGDDGLSQKSAAAGNASWYYSLPRLAASGTITLAGERVRASGSAWLDREWSTSALGADQQGWDWFALQLDNGREVMLYRLRNAEGTTSRFSAGVVVARDGSMTHLEAQDFTLEPLQRWTSPRGGTYPLRWRLHLAALETPLTVTPVRADQELTVSVRYWEGAVDVTRAGERVGRGYVELTGYSDQDP
jgi:predicted secreted hydrolase